MDEVLYERYQLAIDRIHQVIEEEKVVNPYRRFFLNEAEFILRMDTLYRQAGGGTLENKSLAELRALNGALYGEVLSGQYDRCYGNPEYAAARLGKAYGALLSCLYTEIRGMIVFAFEQRLWDMTIVMELFLEVYRMFADEAHPKALYIRNAIYYYVSDYAAAFTKDQVRGTIDPSYDFLTDIVMHADLCDLRYLYRYGEYITENEERLAAFLNTFSEAEIDALASTYTEGYRTGFLLAKKPLEKKKTVNIRYRAGFERIVRAAVRQFAAMGLAPTIYRSAVHLSQRSAHGRIGFYGAVPNPQFDYDHKNDAALYLDEDYKSKKLRLMQQTYETYNELAGEHGGPAVIEVFGEIPFKPAACKEALTLDETQKELQRAYTSEAGQIVNRYIKGEERSFTIIAFPVPDIGDDFEAIFKETVRINTLDYKYYQALQQRLIDALDKGLSVHVGGRGGNRTDLTIALHPLSDPKKQTNFENCVSDVNIPVGEVFTSPKLKGTNGVLHVGKVYLGELDYVDLELHIKDGMIADYDCANFERPEENRRFIEENLLFHHPTLPMGEFAIGTNTTAYRMAARFGIASKLPILIAEKMGPHFAFGDTCYSWEEEGSVYNPDGKEIIAKDNEVSILRKTDIDRAYFGCHTDITIPYDELDFIRVQTDTKEISLIEGGRFVLPGTEELNAPLEDI